MPSFRGTVRLRLFSRSICRADVGRGVGCPRGCGNIPWLEDAQPGGQRHGTLPVSPRPASADPCRPSPNPRADCPRLDSRASLSRGVLTCTRDVGSNGKSMAGRPRRGMIAALPGFPSSMTASVRVAPKSDRPACGAKRRDGGRCEAKVVWDLDLARPRNGRCRMHGGLSTGPKSGPHAPKPGLRARPPAA